MKLTQEDIRKYGTKDEQKFLKEIREDELQLLGRMERGDDWMLDHLRNKSPEFKRGWVTGYYFAKNQWGATKDRG